MISIGRLGSAAAAMVAATSALGVGAAIYMRPLQPPQVYEQQQQSGEVQPLAQLAPAPATPFVTVVRATRTVSWFRAHQAEATAKLHLCEDNPGDARHDPECANASKADGYRYEDRDNAALKAMGIPTMGRR